jgi:hypothetical protein
MPFITEELVAETQAQAEAAQQEVARLEASAPPENDMAWNRAHATAAATAARLRGLAVSRRSQLAAREEQLQSRQEAVKKLEPQLKKDEAQLRASIDALNAATEAHSSALAQLRTAADDHSHLITTVAARLAHSGLFAQDGATAPGEHHPSGSAGQRGVYVRDVLYRPVRGVDVAMLAIGGVFGRMGGTPHQRTMYELGRSLAAQSHLGMRADGLELPSIQPEKAKNGSNGHAPIRPSIADTEREMSQ